MIYDYPNWVTCLDQSYPYIFALLVLTVSLACNPGLRPPSQICFNSFETHGPRATLSLDRCDSSFLRPTRWRHTAVPEQRVLHSRVSYIEIECNYGLSCDTQLDYRSEPKHSFVVGRNEVPWHVGVVLLTTVMIQRFHYSCGRIFIRYLPIHHGP